MVLRSDLNQLQLWPQALAPSQTPSRYLPAAYWFWHSLPSAVDMRLQLRDFADKGILKILIQARLAIPRALYLGDEFLRSYRQALEIMVEFGIEAGLYDDYNWMSGQAGGRTVDGADHLREQHLFWARTATGQGQISGIEAPFVTPMGPDISGWIFDGGEVEFCDWKVVAAGLAAGGQDSFVVPTDIAADIVLQPRADGCGFSYSGTLGEDQDLTVFLSARSRTSRVINYLMPEAGEAFVKRGLEPYGRIFSDLGDKNPVDFLFFDQPAPNFYTWREHFGALGNSMLFTPDMASTWTEANGKPLIDILMALVGSIGPETHALRARVYAAYADQMHRAFLDPVKAFCKRHGLRMTGHEVLPHVGGFALNGGFSSIDPRVAPSVSFFEFDRRRDETAVDLNNFGPQLSTKLGDSVARANGRARVLAEIYATALRTPRRGAGQWEVSPAILRAQMIRTHMAGARQIVLHALYQSDGADGDPRLFVNPRFDFAPGVNFEPWWDHVRDIAVETGRLSAFLEEMTPDAPVAVLYPLETAFAEGPRHAHATHFGAWCQALDALSVGHMIVDEVSLAAARMEQGVLHCNGLAFKALVLPAAVYLSDPQAIMRIEQFIAAGGSVWASGVAPRRFGEDEAVLEIMPVTVSEPSESLVAALTAHLDLDGPVITAAGNIRSVSGLDPKGHRRLVVFNESDADVDVVVDWGAECAVERWDAERGAVSAASRANRMRLSLQAGQLICLRADAAGTETSEAIDLDHAWDATGEISLVDGWSLSGHGMAARLIRVDLGWEEQGLAEWSATGLYRNRFMLAAAAVVCLHLPFVSVAVEAFVDGVSVGRSNHAPFRFDLGRLDAGEHDLALAVSNTAANRYYAGTPYAGEGWPDKSGLLAPPRLLIFDEKTAETE